MFITFRVSVIRTLVSFTVAAVSLTAQTNNGIISGSVLDSTGAAVDGATVTATNTTTGRVISTTVSGGSYRFPSLLIGKYDVSASAPGFSISRQTGVDVQVSSTAAVNFVLKVGDVTQSLTVSAEGSTILSLIHI